MRRLTISDIKNKKNYSRDSYRRQIKLLQYSILLLLIEGGLIAFMYLIQTQPDFYATNSASAIKPLKALYAPNYSSDALLPPDMPEEMGRKTLEL